MAEAIISRRDRETVRQVLCHMIGGWMGEDRGGVPSPASAQGYPDLGKTG